MNTRHFETDLGHVDVDLTLHMQRVLPGPIERVWRYLVEPDLRRQWLGGGDSLAGLDQEFELVWRNDELTDPPGERPPGFSEEFRMQCTVLEFEPPKRLAFTWSNTGAVRFELKPQGEHVLLSLTHERLADPARVLMVGPGWHAHLDLLRDRINGQTPPTFWPTWQALRERYTARLQATA